MSIPFENDITAPSAAQFEAEQLDIWGRGIKMTALYSVEGHTTTVGTRLTSAQYIRLRVEADRRKTSMAAILRDAISDWLDVHGRPQ